MLTKYITAAMRQATYKILEDNTFFGEISALSGVWADGDSLEQCREDLQEVLEAWIALNLHLQKPLPEIDGQTIDPFQRDELEDAIDLQDVRAAREEIKREGTVGVAKKK